MTCFNFGQMWLNEIQVESRIVVGEAIAALPRPASRFRVESRIAADKSREFQFFKIPRDMSPPLGAKGRGKFLGAACAIF